MENFNSFLEEHFIEPNGVVYSQSGAMHLHDESYLLIFWSMDPSGNYTVKTQQFTLE